MLDIEYKFIITKSWDYYFIQESGTKHKLFQGNNALNNKNNTSLSIDRFITCQCDKIIIDKIHMRSL